MTEHAEIIKMKDWTCYKQIARGGRGGSNCSGMDTIRLLHDFFSCTFFSKYLDW